MNSRPLDTRNGIDTASGPRNGVNGGRMRFRVLLPNEVLLDCAVRKVVAEAIDGHFCLLPRHIDFVTALVPGLVSFQKMDGREEFLATDEAVLIKCGGEVLLSTRWATLGEHLGAVKAKVEEQMRVVDERERAARSAAARLEAGLVRRFMEFDTHVAGPFG
ncbi:MAG: F0F1 ATP synthase subunit epsilon [Pirellulaceae bacterium]|nr:MAG: F0F1 ATP synthase subunit epsilon [Pirellulaceae bacterium]